MRLRPASLSGQAIYLRNYSRFPHIFRDGSVLQILEQRPQPDYKQARRSNE